MPNIKDLLIAQAKKAGIDIESEKFLKWIDSPAFAAEQVPEEYHSAYMEKTFGETGAINSETIRNRIHAGTFDKIERDMKKAYSAIYGEDTPFDDWYAGKRAEERANGKKKNAIDILGDFYGGIPDLIAEAGKNADNGGGTDSEEVQKLRDKVKNLQSAIKEKDNDRKRIVEEHLAEIDTLKRTNYDQRLTWNLEQYLTALPFDPNLKRNPKVFDAVREGIMKGAKDTYEWKQDETGAFVPYRRDNPELRVVDKTTNEPVPTDDLIRLLAKDYLDPSGGKGGENGASGTGTPPPKSKTNDGKNVGRRNTVSWM